MFLVGFLCVTAAVVVSADRKSPPCLLTSSGPNGEEVLDQAPCPLNAPCELNVTFLSLPEVHNAHVAYTMSFCLGPYSEIDTSCLDHLTDNMLKCDPKDSSDCFGATECKGEYFFHLQEYGPMCDYKNPEFYCTPRGGNMPYVFGNVGLCRDSDSYW